MPDFEKRSERHEDSGSAKENASLRAGYCALPPAEIGPVSRGWTNMRRNDEPWPLALRLAFCFLGAFGGVVLSWGIVPWLMIKSPEWRMAWSLGLPAVGAVLAWCFTMFRRVCGYVGAEGVARFRCGGQRNKVIGKYLFYFREAAALRVSIVRQYTKGIYLGTSYDFTWTDKDGNTVFWIDGNFYNETSLPAETSTYHFGKICESGWNAYLLKNRVAHDLEELGYVQFQLKDRDCVRVGPGFLEFQMDEKVYHCDAEELNLEKATVSDGMLHFHRKDARVGWLFSSGVFEFNYYQLANAGLFLILFTLLVAAPEEEKNKQKYRKLIDQLEKESSGDTLRDCSEAIVTDIRAAVQRHHEGDR